MGFVIRFQAPSNNNVLSIPISELKWHCIFCIILTACGYNCGTGQQSRSIWDHQPNSGRSQRWKWTVPKNGHGNNWKGNFYHIISHHPNVRKPVPTIWFRVKSLIEFHEQFRGKKRTETSDRTENLAPKLHQIFRRAFFQLKTRSNVPSKITLYVSCAHTSYKVTVLQTTIYDVLYIVIVLVLVCFLGEFAKKTLMVFIFRPWVTWAHPMLIPVLRSSLLTESCMPFRNKLRR